MSVGVGARGRGGVAPPLLDAVDGVHVYLHVLARLEALAAHGARVRQLARRVHVEDVLLEVAVVAVALAALRARGLAGLTVSGAGAGLPARSWGNDSRQFGVRVRRATRVALTSIVAIERTRIETTGAYCVVR